LIDMLRYIGWIGLLIWSLLWLGLSQMNASTKLVIQRTAGGQLLNVYLVDSKEPTKHVGRLYSYWPSGQPKQQADFDDGVYVGEILEWHENGIPARRMQYAQGREFGLQRGWRADGGSDFAYEMRGGQRYGIPGVMPCVVSKGERKIAFERYLKEAGRMNATPTGSLVKRIEAAELPMFNEATFAPKWFADGALQEHKVSPSILFDHRLARFESSALQGHPTVVSFFFTGCANLCPTTIAQMKLLEARLATQGIKNTQDTQRVGFVAMTVTPLQDDVTALASYAKRFDLGDAWHLITGDINQVEQFAEQSFFAKNTADVHTERAFLLDGDQRIRGVYNVTQPADMARLTQDTVKLSKPQGLVEARDLSTGRLF